MRKISIALIYILLFSVFFSCKDNPTKSEDDTSSPAPNPGGSEVIIGQNQSSIMDPFGSVKDSYKLTQILYLANEIGKSGTIKGLATMASTAIPGEYSHFMIYLITVSRNDLDPAVFHNYEGANFENNLVFQTNNLIYGEQATDHDKWHKFTFDNGFAYNGTDNLLIIIVRNASGDGDEAVGVYGYDTVGYNRIAQITGPGQWIGALQEKALYIKLLFD